MENDANLLISLPIPPEDLLALESIVREHDVFCAFGCEADQDPYSVITWHEQHVFYDSEIMVQFDRNVLSDVLSLAYPASLGKREPCLERGRIGAAIMAFLQLSDITIEPGIALQENPTRGPKELALIRRADNVNHTVYTDIALGRLDHIPPEALPAYNRPLSKNNFRRHIKGRRNLYIGLLKIAELELSPLPPVEKMLELLRWSFSDFLFLASAIIFAGAFFSPKRTRPLLKDLHSKNRIKALTAVNNALWDLQVILAWFRRVQSHQTSNRYWLLCSRDRALKDLAIASVCEADESESDRKGFKTYMERYWPQKDAARITAAAMSYQDDRTNPARRVNQRQNNKYIKSLQSSLEARLMNWHP